MTPGSATNSPDHVTLESLSIHPPIGPTDETVQADIKRLWEFGKDFIILSGPPGVGKSKAAVDYLQKRVVDLDAPVPLAGCRLSTLFPEFRSRVYSDDEIDGVVSKPAVAFVWDLTVLHPQYSYEDLIRGYRMTTGTSVSLSVREGILGFMSRVASRLLPTKDLGPNAVLVLDEINRAPIGQVFGEALYALDRRGELVTTPYELEKLGSGFSIPRSLFLIGTMNSVDRATSGFDFALRRRIATVTLSPQTAPIEKRFKDFPIETRNSVIRLFSLAKRTVIEAEPVGIVPQADLILGHSMFMPPSTVDTPSAALDWLTTAFLVQILPTLIDYQEQGLIKYGSSVSIPFLPQISGGKSLVSDIPRQDVRAWLETLGKNGAETQTSAPLKGE